MRKIIDKRTFSWFSLTAVVLIVAGCDWTSGGGVESWNERWNGVNFSGMYRASDGGPFVVRDYASSSTINEVVANTGGGNAMEQPGQNQRRTETFAKNPNAFSDTKDLASTPIVPGSVIVSTAGSISLSDNGNGNLVGSPSGTGRINYDTGRIFVDFQALNIAAYTVSYLQQAATVPPARPFTRSGRMTRTPIVSGSITFTVGSAYTLRDNGQGGLSGSSGITGTVDYNTGAWTIDFGTSPVPANTAISASYRTQGGTGSGVRGAAIQTLTVFQEGQLLRIRDNNGGTYEGRMGSIRSSVNDGSPAGGTVIAQFTAKGANSQGVEVNMTGTFEGQITAGEGAARTMDDRQMRGTFVDAAGSRGDIIGSAGSARVTIPSANGGAATAE
jgi:hypothetical protein